MYCSFSSIMTNKKTNILRNIAYVSSIILYYILLVKPTEINSFWTSLKTAFFDNFWEYSGNAAVFFNEM